MIQTLIDKLDGFEIIDAKIAQILKVEVANQMQLAIDGGKDPAEWDMRIFLEATNPWGQYQNDPVDPRPIVNVWFDSTNADGAAGGVVDKQTMNGTFNIDCYGYAKSTADGAGHIPGDQAAAAEVHHVLRLVRNILMAATYTYLDLRKLVGQRWPESITVFQPDIDNRNTANVVGARLALRVRYVETSPQVVGEIIEAVNVKVKRTEDDEIILESEYIYPL